MKSFNDNTGHGWTITVDVAAMTRVRDLADMNLMAMLDPGGGVFEKLTTDPVSLVETVYAVIKPQADAMGLTYTQFVERLDGAAIEAAGDNLVDEVIAFFPPAKRQTMTKVIEAGRLAEQKAMTAAQEVANDPELASKLESLLLNPVGTPSIGVPESSASTPAG